MKTEAGKIRTGTDHAAEKQTLHLPEDRALKPDPLQGLYSSGPQGILALQRAAGNRAVTRWLQAKLVVGPLGDRYEQEADRVAEQVVSSPLPQPSAASQPGTINRQGEEEELQTSRLAPAISPLQRAPEEEEELQTRSLQRSEEEEEPLQGKSLQRAPEEEEELQTKPLQRAAEEEEEEPLQTKHLQRAEEEEELLQGKLLQREAEEEEEVQAKPAESAPPQPAGEEVEQRLTASKGQGSPLPPGLRAALEPRFGTSFSRVQVHTGSEAVQMNRDLKARAFTHGKDIYMGQGQYNPGSLEGQRLLAHELTHVIQQTGAEQISRQPLIQRSALTDAIDEGRVSPEHQDTYRSDDEMRQGSGHEDTPFSREWYVVGGNRYHSQGEHLLVHAHYRSIAGQIIDQAHLKTVKNRFRHEHIQLGGPSYTKIKELCSASVDKNVDLSGNPRSKKADPKLRLKFERFYNRPMAAK